MENIKKLKQFCQEEWGSVIEKILQAPCTRGIKYRLLEDEGLCRRLLNDILESGSIYSLDQHEQCLKNEFPDEVKSAYVNHIIHRAEITADRKAYKGLILYLKKIEKYPQSEQIVSKIADDWRERCKRRQAMMDELQKAGF